MHDMMDKHGYVFSPYNPYEIIRNKYISYAEIMKLKMFEDCFEKLYNSERFKYSLELLVRYFDSPFEMYEKISLYFDEKKLTFQSISSKNLYNLLYEFAEEIINEDNLDQLGEKLLLDYYCSEKSEIIPLALKKYVPLNKQTSALTKTLLHEKNLHREKTLIVRYIRDKAYLMDYAKKHPVTGRYSVIDAFHIDIER
ncbi:hypothetical protein SDC9_160470 [bioreactor metagenome]|uniref:DUF4080 domain-containing protein n=1 Tax=bioreactor metagenome TaxID=1076179 RepID=A0A645FGQ9_9ZZZZ